MKAKDQTIQDLTICAILFLYFIQNVLPVQYKASEGSFPYEFWKPVSRRVQHVRPRNYYLPTDQMKYYGHYYGKPLSDAMGTQSETQVDPISIPNDLVGEAGDPNYVDDGPYVSRTQTLGRQYYPADHHQEFTHRFSKYQPKKNQIDRRYSQDFHGDSHSFDNTINNDIINHQTHPHYLDKNKINYYDENNYNKNQEHPFYPITESQNMSIKVLQNGLSENSMQPNQKSRILQQIPTRKYQESGQQFDPLDYNRYNNQGVHSLYLTKRRYNENIIDMIKQKFDLTRNRDKKPYPRPQNHRSKNNIYRSSSSNLFTDAYMKTHKRPPPRETPNYSHLYKHVKVNQNPPLKTYKYTYNPHRPTPNRDYHSTRYQPNQQSYHYNDYQPAVNSYPSERLFKKFDPLKKIRNLLYYYRNKEEDYDYINYAEEKKDGFMERLATIQSAPGTLLIPGGIAAVGMGLAWYYFNNVWYPTPVVTARLSKIISNFIDEYFEEDQGRELGKVLEVFRSLETYFVYETDNCRDLIVCQLHQELPSLWNVTQMIAPSFSSVTSDKRTLDGYLQTAKEGALGGSTPCRERHKECSKYFMDILPQMNSIFEDSNLTEEVYGQSRIL